MGKAIKTGKLNFPNPKKNNYQNQNGNNEPKKKSKKIVFNDDGFPTSDAELDEKSKVSMEATNRKPNNLKDPESTMWYEELGNMEQSEEIVEFKDAELREFQNKCKIAFDSKMSMFQKRNPSDTKWLLTALHKGTSRDRATSGALLIQSNPLGNLEALGTVITFTKFSNKTSDTTIDIITDLFINALLPPNRKLLSLTMRCSDWKHLQKKVDLDKMAKDKVLAFWYFESELKEHYSQFLGNLQSALQGTQDSTKSHAIYCTYKLLNYGPEKEQLLLTMIVNKLGDPSNKVASKALHHLSGLIHYHSNMCGVIATETEKLLFRNNITEHAQHFALCFLAQIAQKADANVATNLVKICLSFFKIIVQKGAVNSKTMQAILRCLRYAIVDATPSGDGSGQTGLFSKDVEDTLYRLIHLADIQISLQTFSVLLQIMTVKSGKYDRYYNALYTKMLDLNIGNLGAKTASLYLHILHRSIHIDSNLPRAFAFIKRLLQVCMNYTPSIICGCLIIIHKLIRSRPDLAQFQPDKSFVPKIFKTVMDDTVDDGEEIYKDFNEDGEVIKIEDEDDNPTTPSWDHKQLTSTSKKAIKIEATNYNKYHRVPQFAGAQFILRNELFRFLEHFHPSVQVFAKAIIDSKPIGFYGDPLRDFSLSQFLDRFSFRNPKKKGTDEKEPKQIHHRLYTPQGSRGKRVTDLTDQSVTEDERFILKYLEEKRSKQNKLPVKKEDDNESIASSVDDQEFDAYLDSLGGDGGDVDEDDLDFVKELQSEVSKETKKVKKTGVDSEEIGNGDWDEDENGTDDANNVDDDDDDELSPDDGEPFPDASDDELASLSDDDDADDITDNSDEEDNEPKRKRSKPMSGKDFNKKLKHTDDMNSLFASADDFAEMLEETATSKTHGTLGDLFNKERASEKQINWEQKRLKGSVQHFNRKKGRAFAKTKGKKSAKKFVKRK